MFIKIVLVLVGLVCAKAAVNIGGKEYFFSTDELTWSKASEACHGLQMKMLAIESEEENTAIFDYVSANGLGNTYHWTGGKELNDTATTDGIWTWVDLELPFGFTDWAGSRPNPFARHFCVYLSSWSFSNYWLDGDCGAIEKYICEAY
ncbi:lithostathine-1-like [Neocloeon triangulifer]|uniref:lithostathine-1-like n=1 Tax=Neocloeon triangulifer TaxID=2078957 RepID=UPI00286F5C5E|nr:lithostathine-1-like [Neocloeon triangulifer]